MTLADQIRAFAVQRYIQPARRAKSPVPATVTIVAADVVRELKLQQRCPAVCGAFDAVKFQDEQNIRLLRRGGPKHGYTATWQFPM
jgi:hypothetical protein